MDIPTLIDVVLQHGSQRTLTTPCIPTWDAELADAFSLIEEGNRRVGLVLLHRDHRFLFAHATRQVLGDPDFVDADEGCMGTLWGAEVWFSARAPLDAILVAADPMYIDPERPSPGIIIGVASAERLFP